MKYLARFSIVVIAAFILAATATPAQAASMKTANFISHFEGFSPCPYNDPAGHATIGYGHLLHYGKVTRKDRLTIPCLSKRQGRKLLRSDLRYYQSEVVQRIKGARVTAPMMTALVSFAYNLGPGLLDQRESNGFTRRTRIASHVVRGNYRIAVRQMRIYDGVIANGQRYELPGLTRRRNTEAALFMRGVRQMASCKPQSCPGRVVR